MSVAAATTLVLLVAYLWLTVDVPGGTPQHKAATLEGLENTPQFTVRMNTFRRNAELKRSIDQLSLCPAVAQIQVVWSDQKYAPPDLTFFAPQARHLVVFERHTTDSLNNRFISLLDPPTDGVFSVDDDMTFRCSDLDFAFDTWRSSQRTMVGFVPRLVTWDAKADRHRYRSWWYTWWNGAYNLVLTKACFLHKDYLTFYPQDVPAEALLHIDQHRNCEDLAMSFVVAKRSGAPPIWVTGKLHEMAKSGISSGLSHVETRSRCIDYLGEAMGGVPLLTSKLKAVPAKMFWLWF